MCILFHRSLSHCPCEWFAPRSGADGCSWTLNTFYPPDALTSAYLELHMRGFHSNCYHTHVKVSQQCHLSVTVQRSRNRMSAPREPPLLSGQKNQATVMSFITAAKCSVTTVKCLFLARMKTLKGTFQTMVFACVTLID